MASTIGGFLLGFGLCIFLVSLGASILLGQYYSQIMEWRDEVEQIYNITHSQEYQSAMNALNTLSPYVNQIAEALENPLISYLGLGWLANSLRLIPRAATLMKQVYDSSETAYYAIQAVEVVPTYLQYGMIFGFLLMVIGIVLVVRAGRRVPKAKVQ
ncbi:MAG: hypothetical protein QXI86_06155 [Ignisphaera sp.]